MHLNPEEAPVFDCKIRVWCVLLWAGKRRPRRIAQSIDYQLWVPVRIYVSLVDEQRAAPMRASLTRIEDTDAVAR